MPLVRVNPGATLDVDEQARRYAELMGREAAERQARARELELEEERRRRRPRRPT